MGRCEGPEAGVALVGPWSLRHRGTASEGGPVPAVDSEHQRGEQRPAEAGAQPGQDGGGWGDPRCRGHHCRLVRSTDVGGFTSLQDSCSPWGSRHSDQPPAKGRKYK